MEAVDDLVLRVENLNLNVLVRGGRVGLDAVELGGGARDEGAEGEKIEDLAAVSARSVLLYKVVASGTRGMETAPPYIGGAIFSYTFVVKAIYSRDLSRLVVAADQGDAVWVSYFEAEEKEERFKGVESTIDKVTLTRRWVSYCVVYLMPEMATHP